MASMAERCTMWSCRSGARWARERISATAQVSKEGGRESRNVSYEVKGPLGAMGGLERWMSSPTESLMGGIISAWNMSVVVESLSSVRAFSMSIDEMQGNSST